MSKGRKPLKSSLHVPDKGTGQLGIEGLESHKPPQRLDEQLVLRDFMVEQLGVASFQKLRQMTLADDLEGWNEEGASRILVELINRIPQEKRTIADFQLIAYDENILRHTKKISIARETHGAEPLTWKYFQYLSLLFSEIYLHKYFENEAGFLVELNQYLEKFNKQKGLKLPEFTPTDLNKLAIFQATGSGKTLIMHHHLLQFQHYMATYPAKARELGKVLLISPNEGLSQQHLDEFRLSGIPARRFNPKNQTAIDYGRSFEVQVIESTKLGEQSLDKTVSYTSLLSNNILLVDEGHKDLGGTTRRNMRTALAENGFTFEYSATFSQAIKAASGKDKDILLHEYARCILFDYSYKYFHGDGYGKDFTILNLENDNDIDARNKYMLGSLLLFYQQLKIHEKFPNEVREFNLEKPLMLFVGGNVNGKVVQGAKENQKSDVTDILDFLKAFVDGKFVDTIALALDGNLGIKTSSDKDVFPVDDFRLLREVFKEQIVKPVQKNAKPVFEDMLRLLFNCTSDGPELHLWNIKSAQGEIGIRIGNNDYSGVINVGDDAELLKLCEKRGFHKVDDPDGPSIFGNLNDKNSTIQFLIGSRKFTEGWSSYRVSSIGLMNIGRSEGSQIIQLFGRGVRLKGKDNSLKRSNAFDPILASEPVIEYIRELETLQVAGVRADYMSEFKKFLENEGVQAKNERTKEIKIPIQMRKEADLSKLKVLVLRDDYNYLADEPEVVLSYDDELFRENLILDYYPRVRAEASTDKSVSQREVNKTRIPNAYLDFLDWNYLFQECIQFKNEKGASSRERSWFNLSISRESLKTILNAPDWYLIQIPKDEIEIKEVARFTRIQEIALALLKKYIEKFYYSRKSTKEKGHFELISFKEWEERKEKNKRLSNIPSEYIFTFPDEGSEATYQEIEEKRESLQEPDPYEISIQNIHFSNANHHVYWPLVSSEDKSFSVSPVALNDGEHKFLLDYEKLVLSQNLEGKSWLMRNQSRGRGIGFFQSANFYPDFLWWFTDSSGIDHIVFVDPKGTRNLYGLGDEKILLHKRLNEEEETIRNATRDDSFRFNSFIIGSKGTKSNSPAFRDLEDDKIKESHIYFQSQDGYLEEMYNEIIK